MRTLVTQRVHQLADTLAELKVKVRSAMATELASAVGNAIRDVLVVALLDRLMTASRPTYSSSRSWRDDEHDRDRDRDRDRDAWGDPKDPWSDDDSERQHTQRRYDLDEHEDEQSQSTPAVPAAAALAVGVKVGRLWLAKKGSLAAAVGVGILATALGLAGGPVARALLAVLGVAAEVLTAESVLSSVDSN